MLQTIFHRPYVFAFLITFLVLGRIYWGWKKTFIWLILGYVVAWASEVSSINNGFPYGMYHYVYENMSGELMVAGVPFWDSLSYPFMIFAGYTTAEFVLKSAGQQVYMSSSRQVGKSSDVLTCGHADLRTYRTGDMPTCRHVDLRTCILGAFLTMLLDIIIDPLTVMGDRWFLGHIYYYPNGGAYFGVPLTNFAGWFLVPLVVILLFQLLERTVFKSTSPQVNTSADMQTCRHADLQTFLNPLFYLSIALFNIVITIYIKEPFIASLDCFYLMPVVLAIIWRVKKLGNR